MKGVWVLVLLPVCAVMVVTFQAIQQEINIRQMRQLITSSAQEEEMKVGEITNAKVELQKLGNQLAPLDKQRNELTKKMEKLVKEKQTFEENLNTCQTQKNEAEQQKAQISSVMEFLQTNQNSEIQTLQEEIQILQKQILDRDTKICLYVDKERKEGKKLCMDIMPAGNL